MFNVRVTCLCSVVKSINTPVEEAGHFPPHPHPPSVAIKPSAHFGDGAEEGIIAC
jgi:hypothetical protein